MNGIPLNNSTTINILRNERCYDWVINSIILAINCLVSSFDYVRFIFVPISKNEGAHMLAKLNYCLNQDFIFGLGKGPKRGWVSGCFFCGAFRFFICCFAFVVHSMKFLYPKKRVYNVKGLQEKVAPHLQL